MSTETMLQATVLNSPDRTRGDSLTPVQPASDVRERVVQIIMRSFSSMPSTPTWQDREKATYEMTDAILAALPQPTGSVSKLVERQHNDIGILISMIDGLAEATGEGPEEEDGVLFAQIKQSHNEVIAALSALPDGGE